MIPVDEADKLITAEISAQHSQPSEDTQKEMKQGGIEVNHWYRLILSEMRNIASYFYAASKKAGGEKLWTLRC